MGGFDHCSQLGSRVEEEKKAETESFHRKIDIDGPPFCVKLRAEVTKDEYGLSCGALNSGDIRAEGRDHLSHLGIQRLRRRVNRYAPGQIRRLWPGLPLQL